MTFSFDTAFLYSYNVLETQRLLIQLIHIGRIHIRNIMVVSPQPYDYNPYLVLKPYKFE